MQFDTNKFLRYGDSIYICSAETPKTYLCARSILEEKVLFLQTPNAIEGHPHEEFDSTFYENQSELVFTIYPKMSYQADKNWSKLKPNEDPFKVDLMRKRLEAEQDKNDKMLERMMFMPVTFGSEIQLYHPGSRSFVRATREKHSKMSELYKLQLSKQGGSGLYFKIVPYLTFKREGEKVSLRDLFFLENAKIQATIVSKNLPHFPPGSMSLQEPSKPFQLKNLNINFAAANKSSKHYMPIMEMSTCFDRFEAGLRYQEQKNPLSIKLVNAQTPPPVNKALLWGDYVRIKFMFNDKQSGYFYCDHTIIGNAPFLYCRTAGSSNPYEKESFQAIFQLVPPSEDLYSTSIKFLYNKTLPLRLKHLLTGRYLEISGPNTKCRLSDTIDEHLKEQSTQGSNNNINNTNPQDTSTPVPDTNLKTFQSQPPVKTQVTTIIRADSEMPTQSKASPLLKAIQLLERDKSSPPAFPTDGVQFKNDDVVIGTKGPLSDFVNKTRVTIRHASDDDEEYLTANSVFSIEAFQKYVGFGFANSPEAMLSINQLLKPAKEGQVMFPWMAQAAYQDSKFEPRFHKRNPLGRREYEVQVATNSDNYFHFTSVLPEEISEIMMVQSLLYPIIKCGKEMIESSQKQNAKHQSSNLLDRRSAKNLLKGIKNTETDDPQHEAEISNLMEVLEVIKKLHLWLTTNTDDQKVKNLSFQGKQKIMRELGVVDLLMDLLNYMFDKDFLMLDYRDFSHYKLLAQNIFELLQATIRQNKANNIYVFQWSQLFQKMALDLSGELGVDKLLSQIFYEQIIEIDELRDIPYYLKFENYDIKALNIAIALYRYNPARTPQERDKIITTLIVRDDARKRIFREYMLTEEECEIVIKTKDNQNNDKHLKITTSSEYKEEKLFSFITGIINLSTEITRSKPQVVSSYLREYFQLQLCTDTFINKRWSYYFRSSFLDLFIELYFSIEAQQLPEVAFPNNIKFLNGAKISDEIYDLLEARKSAVLRKFIGTGEEFSIKRFIREFLEDNHKWTDDEHQYVCSVFKLIKAMCLKGLYNREELKKLKFLIYTYLKIGLAIIHDSISPDNAYAKRNVAMQKEQEEKEKMKQKRSKFDLKKLFTRKISHRDKARKQTTASEENSMINDKSIDEAHPVEEEADHEKEEEGYSKTNETSDMILWMTEGLYILGFIEGYELDSKLKEFFQEQKTLKFYNDKLLNQEETAISLSPQDVLKIKSEKNAYVLKYLDDNFVLQNYKHTLLLIEMLLINDLSFTCQIVHLLSLNFNNFKQFLVSLNTTKTISLSNLEVYNYYFKIHDKLRLFKLDLEALHEGNAKTVGGDIFKSIDATLNEILADLYLDGDKASDARPGDAVDVYTIHEDLKFEAKEGKQKQLLLKNIHFSELVTELFRLLMGSGYMFAAQQEANLEKYLKNFLCFYAFFCVNNPENQQLVASDIRLIEELLSINIPSLQPLLLRVVSEIYKDNYSLLIEVPQNPNNVIKFVLEKFFRNFNQESAIRNEFFILGLRIFPTFFQIRNNYLTQSQIHFSNRFYSKLGESSVNINEFFCKHLYNYLHENSVEKHTLYNDNNTVKVPLEISFAISFLNTLSRMVSGPNYSNSVACLNSKSYLSVSDITKLLKVSGEWFNLKLALITFMNNVYIRNKKLEDNEVIDLYTILKENMLDEVNEYVRFLKKRHLYSRPFLQRYILSYERYYSIDTELVYSEIIDEVYCQYVLYGVLEAFQCYADHVKDRPSENDHAILDDYVSSLSDLKEAWISVQNLKGSGMNASPIMNKMLMPIDEPTDHDINDGDLMMPQTNERKKVGQLKRELNRTTNFIKDSEQARALKISQIKEDTFKSKTLKEQLVIDNHVIETKHTAELEILVKFLLELKLESPAKFRKIIKSFMKVIASDETDPETKKSTLQILRKLSNFKNETEIYESIQNDLVQLDFIGFFNYIIINAKNDDDRIEFILGMIDFMDEATFRIQEELLEELIEDEDNIFLETIKRFILASFEDFRENEKNYNEQSRDVQQNAKIVVYKRMYAVNYALELLRLACENHYEAMQNYLREQVQNGVQNKRSINFIFLIADIFNRYTKSVNERNAPLGIKILETLIEMLQGPCLENQLALCSTKLLENLEDLTVEIKNIRRTRDRPIWAEMNSKSITLIQAILEGSYNSYIFNQVSIHINASFFLERMEEIYKKFYKGRKKLKRKQKKVAAKSDHKVVANSVHDLENDILEDEHMKPLNEDYNLYIDEALALAIIIKFLSDKSLEIKHKVEAHKLKMELEEPERYKEFLKAEYYYDKYIGQIELVNKKGDLQRTYFPIMKKTKYLSKVTKTKFLDEVNRESANEKLFGLLGMQQRCTNEMEHFLKLRKKGLVFSLTYFSIIRDLNLLVSLVTNLTILFDKNITNPQTEGSHASLKEGDRMVRALGFVHIILCFVVLILWGVFQAPLEIKAAGEEEEEDEKKNSKKGSREGVEEKAIRRANNTTTLLEKVQFVFSRARYMLFDTYMLYFFLMLTFALLGTFFSKVFFSFLLFDLIDRSVILNNVIKSVTQNYKQLLMTVVLGVMIIYVYATIGYFSVLEDDPDAGTTDYTDLCSSPWHCFLSLANEGIRAGGGIGDVLTAISFGADGYAKRYFYELFYFLTIIIILLNIVFGIIIDTFAELRDEKRNKDFDEKNICFICNLERTAFEKEGFSFEKHIRVEHNVWNYLYYTVYLDEKEKLDYNGTESYVSDKKERNDLSWFPIQRAMCFADSQQEEGENLNAIIDDKFAAFEKQVVGAIKTSALNRGPESMLKTAQHSGLNSRTNSQYINSRITRGKP